MFKTPARALLRRLLRRPVVAPGPDAADLGTAFGLEVSLEAIAAEAGAPPAPTRRAARRLRFRPDPR
jgi:hypothetical protein